MATHVALALIATTLIAIALVGWATVYYVPLVLTGDDAEETHGSGTRPS